MSRGHGATQRWLLDFLSTNWAGGRNWYGVRSLARLRQLGAGADEGATVTRGAVVSMLRAAHALEREGLVSCRLLERPVTVEKTLIAYNGNSYSQPVVERHYRLLVRLRHSHGST